MFTWIWSNENDYILFLINKYVIYWQLLYLLIKVYNRHKNIVYVGFETSGIYVI